MYKSRFYKSSHKLQTPEYIIQQNVITTCIDPQKYKPKKLYLIMVIQTLEIKVPLQHSNNHAYENKN